MQEWIAFATEVFVQVNCAEFLSNLQFVKELIFVTVSSKSGVDDRQLPESQDAFPYTVFEEEPSFITHV